MEIKDWIPLFSALIIVIPGAFGWYINYINNNKNEIAKERRKYRMDTLKSIFSLLSEFRNNSPTNNVQISRLNKQIHDTFIDGIAKKG